MCENARVVHLGALALVPNWSPSSRHAEASPGRPLGVAAPDLACIAHAFRTSRSAPQSGLAAPHIRRSSLSLPI